MTDQNGQPRRDEIILPGDGTMPRVEYTESTGQPEGTVMQSGRIVESPEDYTRFDRGADPAMAPSPSDTPAEAFSGRSTEPEQTTQTSVGDLDVDHSGGLSLGIPSEAPLSVQDGEPERLVTPETEAKIRERAKLAAEIAQKAMAGTSTTFDQSLDAFAAAIYNDLAKREIQD